MGTIGRWIDSLTDEQRQRIIEHPEHAQSGILWWDPRTGEACLVGCVIGEPDSCRPWWDAGIPSRSWASRQSPDPEEQERIYQAWGEVGERFPTLAFRFGTERVWRICRERAARRNAEKRLATGAGGGVSPA